MQQWQIVRHEGRLELSGALRIADAAETWHALQRLIQNPGLRLDLDLSQVTVVDGVVMALIAQLRASLLERGIASGIVGASDQVATIVHLYRADQPPATSVVTAREKRIARLGAGVEHAGERARGLVAFSGEIALALVSMLRSSGRKSRGAIGPLVERAGPDGIAIVVFLNFLVGFVMAIQSSPQLKLYGANVYVADIVGVSVSRELGPLMTAIIIAGRSGAAYAAELGTMRVSEEIDALRTLGIGPIPYLVVPRILALALVAPMLTLLGDVCGIMGGLVVGMTTLDLTHRAFFQELATIVVPSDIWTGLVKSVAFGTAIALIGCQQGLVTRGAASGVGRGTTRTVVQCLFTIVIVDTMFTVVFRGLGV